MSLLGAGVVLMTVTNMLPGLPLGLSPPLLVVSIGCCLSGPALMLWSAATSRGTPGN
ncbi:hypothetical protein ACFQQB_06960 [Nonomuraea rubra]